MKLEIEGSDLSYLLLLILRCSRSKIQVGSIGAAGKWQEFCTLSSCLALGHDRSSSDSDSCHSNCICQANNLRCNHLPCLF
jgi:hypothetical protein